MEQKKKGGIRIGAGRKPSENPKRLISLYVEKKAIWIFGNEEKLKNKLYEFIRNYNNEPIPQNIQRQYEYANGANDGKIVPQNIVDFAKGNINQPNTSYQPLDKAGIYREAILTAETLKEFNDIQKEIERDSMNFKIKSSLYEILTTAKENKGFIYNDEKL